MSPRCASSIRRWNFRACCEKLAPAAEADAVRRAIIRRSSPKRRWTAWLAALPADAPVAVAVGRDDGGDGARVLRRSLARRGPSHSMKIPGARDRRARYQSP